MGRSVFLYDSSHLLVRTARTIWLQVIKLKPMFRPISTLCFQTFKGIKWQLVRIIRLHRKISAHPKQLWRLMPTNNIKSKRRQFKVLMASKTCKRSLQLARSLSQATRSSWTLQTCKVWTDLLTLSMPKARTHSKLLRRTSIIASSTHKWRQLSTRVIEW